MIIEVKNITKSYKRGNIEQNVLRGISLSLDKGFYVLKGPSGSGKSTFLNILGLLDNQDSGELSILGKNSREMNDKTKTDFRLNNMGFIFQQFNLIPVLTAYENVEYPLLQSGLSAKERKNRIMPLLESLGMDTMSKKRPNQLSGGQQQRIAIARSLVNNPKIILADEPTASLDSENTEIITNILLKLTQQHGVLAIIATHDDRVVAKSSHVLNMKDGVIV